MNPSQELKSLKKALRILGYLNQMGDATTSQVAGALGLPRSTANRILETFTVEGYLQKMEHSDYYRLTSAVQQLSSGYQAENLLVEVAAPLIADLCSRIGWSVSVLTPRGSDMVIRLTTNFDTSLALDRYAVGLAVPMMHATAGFCYLATCAESERERLLELCRQSPDPLQRLSRNQARVDFLIDAVRKRGYSHLEFQQYREGNIGVPLFCEARPLGGLVMRYIKSAMKGTELRDKFVPILQETASLIAEKHRVRRAQHDEEASRQRARLAKRFNRKAEAMYEAPVRARRRQVGMEERQIAG
jgi:IclR family mhp operon transcriptional activator